MKNKGSLPKYIAQLRLEIIRPYLERAFLDRLYPDEPSKEEILKELSELESLPENDQIKLSGLKIMADMIAEYWLKSTKGRKLQELEQIKQFAIDNPALTREIGMVYGAIKQIGFSGSLVDAEKQWQSAALSLFDNSNEFIIIQRKYLEDKSLYQFSGGQERRDFQHRILNMIIRDRLSISVGDFAYKELLTFIK